jgi:hydroxylamine reductase (hybrid-cluster protein)
VVEEVVKEQLPEMLSEVVKQNIAVNLVKHTKNELKGIHGASSKKIEELVVGFAENKLVEAKNNIEENVKNNLNNIIATEFKKMFEVHILPM